MYLITAMAAMAIVGTGAQGDEVLRVSKLGRNTVLSLGRDAGFHITSARVESPTGLRVGGSSLLVATWTESRNGKRTPYYAISLDGSEVQKTTETTYEFATYWGAFDPKTQPAPVPGKLAADASNETYLVQFVTQPMQEYRDALEGVGAVIYSYFPYHAYSVRLTPAMRDRVKAMPFVRAVVPFHPGIKLSPELVQEFRRNRVQARRYNIGAFAWGPEQKTEIAGYIQLIGGRVTSLTPEGQWFEAYLTPAQLDSVIRLSQVMYVGIATEIGVDMDITRQVGGANLIETTYGFTGQGVRAEVMDGGVRSTHQAFNPPGIIFHRPNTTDISHGTSTTGIVFGNGNANPSGRGMLPSAQPIFANYNSVNALGTRFAVTQELLGSPYFAIFQSNSWGHSQVTTYNDYSADMDDILFRNDIMILNSQSNTGNQNSRPEAWAKNVVSVGGISHFNTATRADDAWTSASIGPAADGRIKPDISFWYDNVLCPSSTTDTSYTTGFNGTSAATPISAGHAGIMYQMWGAGWFYGNCLGSTIFDNRGKTPLMKAILLNTAWRYTFSGAGANLGRYRQGYGTPDLGNIHALVNIPNQPPAIMWVNEEDVLTNLQTKTYRLWVPPGTPEFRATMAYNDPAGVPNSAAIDRVNDLTLKVTAPNGTVYYGNNGLTDSNVSTPGGSPNTVDTVENVFVPSPLSGVWTVEVIGSDINTDARLETPGTIDADFGLFVAGVQWTLEAPNALGLRGTTTSGSLADTRRSDNTRWSLDGRDPINDSIGQVGFETQVTVPGGTLSALRIRVESQVVEPNNRLYVYLVRQAPSEALELITSAVVGSSDGVVTAIPTGNLNRFISGGKITAYLVWRRTDNGLDLTTRIDQVRFDCQP